MPNKPATRHRQIRIDDELWAELGDLAAQLGTDRSAILRDLARGWVRRQRRQLERDQAMRHELRAVTRDA